MTHAGRRIAVITTMCAAVLGAVIAPTAHADSDAVQDAMQQTVAAGVPGSYAQTVTRRDDWYGSAGVGDVRTGGAPDPTGRFRAGSVTKTFVATVVLQLVAEGRFGLDDKIADHLPGLLPYPEPITIRQLLQHTSGLPRDIVHWKHPEEIDTQRWRRFEPTELIKLGTDGKPLLFAPGTGFSYSNIGYTTLGLLVEKTTGHDLDDELTRRIFRPLHLSDTSFPEHFPFMLRPAARGYEQIYLPEDGLTDVTSYVMSRLWGSGNLVSSTNDLNDFFRALLGGKLLPAEQLTEMKRARPNALGPFGYGLGLMTRPSPCGGPAWWGHGGDVAGYNTWSMHTGDLTKQVTVGMNQDLSAPTAAHENAVSNVLPAALCDQPQPRTTTTERAPHLGPQLGE